MRPHSEEHPVTNMIVTALRQMFHSDSTPAHPGNEIDKSDCCAAKAFYVFGSQCLLVALQKKCFDIAKSFGCIEMMAMMELYYVSTLPTAARPTLLCRPL
jgi:hypothetical protein